MPIAPESGVSHGGLTRSHRCIHRTTLRTSIPVHLLLAVLLLSVVSICRAQTTTPRFTFALPFHPGTLSLPRGSFRSTGLSAKPDGNLLALRAEDRGLLFSGSLFVWPQHPYLTAAACREAVLQSEGQSSLAAAMNRIELQSSTGADIALVLMIPRDSSSSAVRAFVASGNLCADLTFSSPRPVAVRLVPLQQVKDILLQLVFDPNAAPTFRGAFTYATAEFNARQYAGAAAAYRAALRLADTDTNADTGAQPLTLRRVTAVQLSTALRLSGHLNQSRAVDLAAIARDPAYPLYYYNLARDDAEQGDAAAARTHLRQAFDRQSNTLPGESLPDPATDPSILRLRSDPAFWAFVQTLHPAPKP